MVGNCFALSDIDECASSPCVGGVCVDGVNQYTCNCDAGKVGINCEFGKSFRHPFHATQKTHPTPVWFCAS